MVKSKCPLCSRKLPQLSPTSLSVKGVLIWPSFAGAPNLLLRRRLAKVKTQARTKGRHMMTIRTA